MSFKAAIIGAAGYVGGELLRLLYGHPLVEVSMVTSRRYAGEYVYRVHPNLRGYFDLKFEKPEVSRISDKCDLVLSAAPHGSAVHLTKEFYEMGMKVIDLSADYRLRDPEAYERYYGFKHPYPELLEKRAYGLPELHREEIKRANLVATPGCNATAAILSLAPLASLIGESPIIVNAIEGSSAGGSSPSLASHHPERANVIRPYKPAGHRHEEEIKQEIGELARKEVKVVMSAVAVDLVRGLLTVSHVFSERVDEREIWGLFRKFVKDEPFLMIVKDKKATFKLPDPKIAIGTNRAYLAFEADPENGRVVTIAAIDNLVKGAAGNAVQSLNIMLGIDERTNLDRPSLHPV